jgi:PAS domain S-box-containing protein
MWANLSDDHPLIAAVVGGGQGCEAILRMVKHDVLANFRMSVVGVADIDLNAVGVRYAREIGIERVTTNYRDLYTIPDLDLIIELTGSVSVRDEIEGSRPRHVRLIDHFAARLFWELHQAEESIIAQRNLLRRQVEAERERIAQIFDSIPHEVLVLDKDMAVLHANATFLKQHKVALRQVLERPYYDISEQLRGDCEMELIVDAFRQAREARSPCSLVREYFDPNGEVRYAAVDVAPLLSTDGRLTGMIEMTRDISDRILLEEELKATEVQLKKFMELAPLATYVKNRQGQYIEVNRATCRLLGRKKSEIIGKTDDELLPCKAASIMRKGDQYVLQTKKELSFEAQALLGETPVFLSTIKYPVLEAGGEVSAVAALSKDITGEREIEAELVRTREYLQYILDNAPLMIITTDLDGRIVSFNRQAETSHGYEAKEVIGKPVAMLFASSDEWQPLMRRVQQGSTVQEHETTHLRKDGAEMSVSVTLAQLTDYAGRMIGTLSMIRDISQRQALMNQVIQIERLAAVGRLAAGVAHEINNPLAVIAEITGYLQDLVTEQTAESRQLLKTELHEGLPKVADQIRRCRNITSRLLSFARKSEVHMDVADVSVSLEEILPFLEKEARLAGVKIHRQIDADILPVSINDLQLEEVLINLIKNAIQAMRPRGYGNIWLDSAQSDGNVVLSIKDDGPGIAQDILDRLFDPFVTSKPFGQGTGLGLSICYGIVKHHGGKILVDSKPGEGAIFQVILPVHYQTEKGR